MGNKYLDVDNIKIYNPEISSNHEDFNAKYLDSLYYEVENKLFWSIIRKEYILKKIRRHINNKSSIIEVGAGTGYVSKLFLENGYINIAVGDIHLNGLKYAQAYGIKKCYQFDLLKTPFENKFDAVCLFDVLEHIKNDKLALNQSLKMLKGGGHIVITVPSHMWLWNRSDRIVGHKRRYIKQELKNKLIDAGFRIIDIEYFFIFITPLLFIRRLMDKDDGSEITVNEKLKYFKPNWLINKVLFFISKAEIKISKILPNKFGGSLFAIAQKITNDKI